MNPATKNLIATFKQNKRGYYSAIFILTVTLLCLGLELFINNRALVVKFAGEYYFPVFKGFYSGTTFGQEIAYEADYRQLKADWAESDTDNWIIMPLIPYNPQENDFRRGIPAGPALFDRHLLGTDTQGRDILSRLLYGYRTTIFFALALYALNTIVGVIAGGTMGYFGGWYDLIFQRFVEIWATLPILYMLIILGSFITPNIYILLIIFAILNWTGISWLIRAEILREKQLKYAQAALSVGASNMRVIFVHLLPNSIVPIVANFPFHMIGAVGLLTSLDYLGYGLPVPTPSWGELIKQGQQTFDFAPWIILAPMGALVSTLLAFAFIGEAIRDAFDPQKNIRYS